MNTPYLAFSVRHRSGWGTGCGPRPTVCAECGDTLPPPPPLGVGGSTGYGCDSQSMVIDAASYTRLTREAPPALKRGDVLEVSRAYCLDCCGRADADAMRATGRATLYIEPHAPSTLSASGYRWFRVTNWPGTLDVPAYGRMRRYAGGFGTQRTDVWFQFAGARWYGVNRGDNGILRCRRLKRKQP